MRPGPGRGDGAWRRALAERRACQRTSGRTPRPPSPGPVPTRPRTGRLRSCIRRAGTPDLGSAQTLRWDSSPCPAGAAACSGHAPTTSPRCRGGRARGHSRRRRPHREHGRPSGGHAFHILSAREHRPRAAAREYPARAAGREHARAAGREHRAPAAGLDCAEATAPAPRSCGPLDRAARARRAARAQRAARTQRAARAQRAGRPVRPSHPAGRRPRSERAPRPRWPARSERSARAQRSARPPRPPALTRCGRRAPALRPGAGRRVRRYGCPRGSHDGSVRSLPRDAAPPYRASRSPRPRATSATGAGPPARWRTTAPSARRSAGGPRRARGTQAAHARAARCAAPGV
jgi:hypothetical protein